MADLASMIYGTAQNAEQNIGQGFTQSVHEGAQLALQKEQLDTEQQRMQMQQQQLNNAKIEKLYGFIQDAHKYTNGANRNAHLKAASGMATAMGIPDALPPGALDGLGTDDGMGRMYTLGNMVEAGVISPSKALDTMKDKAAFAQLTPTPPEAIDLNKSPLTPEMKDYMQRQTEVQTATIRGSGTVPAPDKELSDFGKQVANPSSRAALGRPKAMMDAADSVKQLTDAGLPKNASREQKVATYNKLDTRQISEVVKGLDRLLSQSNPTVHGQEGLAPPTTPETFMAKWGEKAGNLPQGATQGEFVARMMETVNRERDMNAAKYKQGANALKSAYPMAIQKHGATMDKMISDIASAPPEAPVAKTDFTKVNVDKLRAYVNNPAHANNPDYADAKAALGGR